MTLTEFLQQTGAQLRVFDMGRRITKLARSDFEKFEQARIPYPQPFLNQAWLGLLFWDPKQTEQHFIWFLKFPLDEQGFLVQAMRDDFLKRLVETVQGNRAAAQEGTQTLPDNVMKDNPLAFTPSQEQLACFNAKAKRLLKQPASRYYEFAQEYFTGQHAPEQWEQVGLQGVADLAARLDCDAQERRVAAHLPAIPDAPFSALCGCLEHEAIGHELAQAIAARIEPLLAQDNADVALISAGLRGLSHSRAPHLRNRLVAATLASRYGAEVEILAAIAGRAWEALLDPLIAQSFMECLAHNPVGQEVFNRVVRDLIFIPELRAHIMVQLRNPERSETLAQAIGRLLQGTRQ